MSETAAREFERLVEVVAELVGLAELVEGADLVITGEGRFDAQTLRGKTPFGVARIAREHGVPVIVIAGTLGEDYQDLYAHGIDAAFALPSGPMTLEQAADFAVGWLEHADYGREPDHGGDNGKGWRLYCEDWGHVDHDHYAFAAVQPVWAMYGK